jgi:undecaprenyl-phosphate galactose phosphotransferase
MESGVPIIFVQRRVGLNGKTFDLFKFRSMVNDADRILSEWRVENQNLWDEYQNHNFKLHNDPRLTKVGKWLRQTSIDELPQLWNVLKGDMSLVGPRPLLERELPCYGDSIRLYRAIRPGVTGLWQISGRSETTFSDRVALDAWYVRNWSLWHDIIILLKTIKVVLKHEGAY